MDRSYERLTRPPAQSFFLFGIRGVGKSTWARAQFAQAPYFDFLDERVYQDLLVDPGRFTAEIEALEGVDWVVVDEVQRIPNVLRIPAKVTGHSGRT